MALSRRRAVPRQWYRPASTTGSRREIAHPVAAWFGRGAFRAFALLPYPAIHRIGGVVGSLTSRLDPRMVRHTEVNLRLCFPGMADDERAKLGRTSLEESGRAITELAAVWGWRRDRVLGLVRETSGEAYLEQALARGRGILLLGPHLGAWELMGLYCSSRLDFTALYTPPFDPALDRFFARGRTRLGGRLAPATFGGTRLLLQALGRGAAVGIMPDQDPGRGAGVFVPFFGVLAATTTLVARLARDTGAAIVLAWAERLRSGAGFRVHFRPGSPETAGDDLLAAVTAMNADIERLVRERPEQYLWSYKRFRIRPEGGTNPYARTHDVAIPAR